MSFATVLDQGPTINVGPDATDWPRQQDPAMIAPFLCKQQVCRAFIRAPSALALIFARRSPLFVFQINQNRNVAQRAGVYYRLMYVAILFCSN